VLFHCCRDVFTAQLRGNECSTDPQRTLLATPLLLLHDVTAYMIRSSAACIQAITWQCLFLCLHSFCFQQIHISPSLRLLVLSSLSVCHRSLLWLNSSAVFTLQPLPLLVLSSSLIGCQSLQVYNHHPVSFSSQWGKLPRVASVPTFQLLLCVQSLFQFHRGLTPPQCPVPHFFEVPTICFMISSSKVFLKLAAP
jgi:hypothetical protein